MSRDTRGDGKKGAPRYFNVAVLFLVERAGHICKGNHDANALILSSAGMSSMRHHFKSRVEREGPSLYDNNAGNRARNPIDWCIFSNVVTSTFAKRHSVCSNHDWVTSVFHASPPDITTAILQKNSNLDPREIIAFPTSYIPYLYNAHSTLGIPFSHFTSLYSHTFIHAFKFDCAISSWYFSDITNTGGTSPLKRVKNYFTNSNKA